MPDDEEREEVTERPATWENELVGKATEALGKVIGSKKIAAAGEEQSEIAHETHEEYVEHKHDDHEG